MVTCVFVLCGWDDGTCAAEAVRVFSEDHLNVLEAVLTEVHISVHHIRRFAYNLSECQLSSKSAANFYSVQQHVPDETTLRLHQRHECADLPVLMSDRISLRYIHRA